MLKNAAQVRAKTLQAWTKTMSSLSHKPRDRSKKKQVGEEKPILEARARSRSYGGIQTTVKQVSTGKVIRAI